MPSRVTVKGPILPRYVRSTQSTTAGFEDKVFPDAKSMKDLALSAIQNSLSTRRGEVVMFPDQGSEIATLAFNNFLSDIAAIGEQMIRESITRDVPWVEIVSIQAKEIPNDNSIIWSLLARLKDNPAETFTVQVRP
jgi:phage baseplate assembly protein W